MKGLLQLSLVIALIGLPFRSLRFSSRYLAAATIICALAFYFYILYIGPRLP